MRYVIEFAPPMSGLEGEFNTVRLGVKWSRNLKPGDTVFLMDKPKSAIFGQAEVTRIEVGKLGEVASVHAAQNHNQKHSDPDAAPQRLIENMVKRYGPHKCDQNKRVTVIYLRVKT